MNQIHQGSPRRSTGDNPDMHEVIVERIPEHWGLGDPVAERLDQGYTVKVKGTRRVTLQIDRATFEARIKAEQEEANTRLTRAAAPDIRDPHISRVTQQARQSAGLDAKQLAEGVQSRQGVDE